MRNVAILMGGCSSEKEISIKSGNTIFKHIDSNKYNAYKIICEDINRFHVILNGEKIPIQINDFSFKFKNERIQLHKIFMMIHGAPGETGELCNYFESINIPYTSCNEITSKLTFNKSKCNKMLHKLKYKVPKSEIYSSNIRINYPCIVKPNCNGSSFGISKVNTNKELKQAIEIAKQHAREIIIEDFIEGREVTCAVYNSNNILKALPITEIISENEIFDYDAKYNGKSKEITPAKIEHSVTSKIKKISKKIYTDLNLKGIVRIDFIIKKRTPYIIEINTIPGFSEQSIVPKMLKVEKITITDFISNQLNNI